RTGGIPVVPGRHRVSSRRTRGCRYSVPCPLSDSLPLDCPPDSVASIWKTPPLAGGPKVLLGLRLDVVEHHRQIPDDDVVSAEFLHAVVDHDVAIGAGDRHLGGTGFERLLGTLDVDLLADVLLHPEAGTAGATAQGPRPVPTHLRQLDVAGGGRRLPGGEVDVVVPAQIAGVVIGDPSTRPGALARVQPAL